MQPILAGNYVIVATNSCGTTTQTINVIVNLAPVITLATNTACVGGNNGAASISVVPNTCTLLWSSGETTNYIDNKAAGPYSVTATNPATTCTTTKSLTIN
jgi:hypothetical protein